MINIDMNILLTLLTFCFDKWLWGFSGFWFLLSPICVGHEKLLLIVQEKYAEEEKLLLIEKNCLHQKITLSKKNCYSLYFQHKKNYVEETLTITVSELT